MKTWFAAFIIVAMPLAASAQTIETLQAQLNEILAQLAGLQSTTQTQTQTTVQTQAQIAQTPTLSIACPNLARNLSRGSSGVDVGDLQKFLRAGGYLFAEPTNFFGPLTEAALQAFQKKEGIVTSGTPQSNGFGALGPKTRAIIATRCGASSASVCPQAPALPSQQCVGTLQKQLDMRSCHVGWTCLSASSTYPGNKPPIISAIQGPASLYVGESGLWTVVANDPEGGALSYSILWGDEGSESILTLLAGYSQTVFVPSPSFSHVFARTGTFSPQVTARDAAGQDAWRTFAISVLSRPVATGTVSTTPGVGACTFSGKFYPAGTETEGYTQEDLCLATNGVCLNRLPYLPKFKCTASFWEPLAQNPYPNLLNYGNVVGSACSSHGAAQRVSVSPGTQICRGLLCATAQNYTALSVTCTYTNWVDWGAFSAGATTTTICSSAQPCEYGFGESGRACAAKQNNVCPAAPYSSHPLGT